MSVGNKEPVRDDYVNSSPLSRPQPESMYDIEAGYKLRKENLLISANYYFMNYTDQLILTGKINDVGAYIRENVSKSYRTGIEVEFAYNISKRINVSGNATFSSNKINEYPEYVDDYDNGIQILNIYKKTDIAFSPAVVSAGKFEYIPFKNIRADFISKYVSRQYLDNTSNEKRQLKAYSISDVLLNYTWKNSHAGEIGITFCIKNIFDNLYESNGYTYSYRSGGELVTQNFYYPQAGINWMGGISLKF